MLDFSDEHSSLDTTQWQDSLVLGITHTTRSPPHFKCYNAPTLAQTVMDSSGYHGISNSTTKGVI